LDRGDVKMTEDVRKRVDVAEFWLKAAFKKSYVDFTKDAVTDDT
jgi:hypothetical protein